MSLMLHRGAEPIDVQALQLLETPHATATHVPIPHHRLVDTVRHTLAFFGHDVKEESHGVTPDGMLYFGVMLLVSRYGGYQDAVALRNSHNKKFPIGIGFGGHVFCCDNLSLIADQVVNRRHTAKVKRDLPGIIGEMVEPLADARLAQARSFERYKDTLLLTQHVDHAIMDLYRQGIINVTRIAEVWREWEEPSFEEFDQFNAWRLFNAVTFVLNGAIVGNPREATKIHQVIDGVCTRI